ncbi:MAG: response regulator transcription factor [Bacteroidia bacterium]
MLPGIIIYEDNIFLRESISQLISGSGKFKLLSAFENCNHISIDMQTLRPDVVLMDIEMAGTDGLEGLKLIRKFSSTIHVIMLTVFDDNDRVLQAICSGASGYLIKNTEPEKILEAINDVLNGGAPMTPSIARKVLQLFPKVPAPGDEMNKLTVREQEVLKLLSSGNSYKMIAAQCSISIETVRTYIKRIYEKLQVHSATEAIAKIYPNQNS